jgi:hypothetical protein
VKPNFVGYVAEKYPIYTILGIREEERKRLCYLNVGFVFLLSCQSLSSPSGCTFWGKKQWSRKKVILWQVATLIGAPVIIALAAGVAVPGVIIGVPLWTARKIFRRYNTNSHTRVKRNLLVALGVSGSIVVSPIIAALTVGIGVPILLAYVYGVGELRSSINSCSFTCL